MVSALYSGSDDATIRCWSSDGAHIRTLTGHEGGVWTLAVASDGVLFSGSFDRTIKVWHPDGTNLQTLKGHDGTVFALAMSPNGMLLSGAADGTIRVWSQPAVPQSAGLAPTSVGSRSEARGALFRYEHTLTGHDDAVCALAVASDGRV